MTVARRVAAWSVAIVAGVLLWRLRPDATAQPARPANEPAPVRWAASWVPRPPATWWTRLLAYVWASPLTAAGILLGAASRTTPELHEGVVLFPEARGLGGWMLRYRGFAASTLGHAIIAAGRPSATLMRHELVHVRQAERWGPLFVPLYVAALARYGYRANPFERAAVAEADGPAG